MLIFCFFEFLFTKPPCQFGDCHRQIRGSKKLPRAESHASCRGSERCHHLQRSTEPSLPLPSPNWGNKTSPKSRKCSVLDTSLQDLSTYYRRILTLISPSLCNCSARKQRNLHPLPTSMPSKHGADSNTWGCHFDFPSIFPHTKWRSMHQIQKKHAHCVIHQSRDESARWKSKASRNSDIKWNRIGRRYRPHVCCEDDHWNQSKGRRTTLLQKYIAVQRYSLKFVNLFWN